MTRENLLKPINDAWQSFRARRQDRPHTETVSQPIVNEQGEYIDRTTRDTISPSPSITARSADHTSQRHVVEATLSGATAIGMAVDAGRRLVQEGDVNTAAELGAGAAAFAGIAVDRVRAGVRSIGIRNRADAVNAHDWSNKPVDERRSLVAGLIPMRPRGRQGS